MKKNTNTTEKQILKTQITKSMIIKSIVNLVIIFCVLAGFRYVILENQIYDKKNKAEYITTIAFEKISMKMKVAEEKIKTIINLSVDSQGNISEFDHTAASIINKDYISCIILAPKGIVQYVYPYAGNEYLKGYNFWDNSNNKDKLGDITNEDKNISAVCGPYFYRNGKTYLVIRVPIFLENGNTLEPWGFACALVDFPDALTDTGINLITTNKFNYKLYRTDINNKERVILSLNKNKIKNGIIVQRDIFNQKWNILIEPQDGWYNINHILFETLVIIFISILLSIIIFDYLRLKDTGKMLTKMVNVDTLTGVFSRKYFFDYVEAEIKRNKRFGICYIDVDKFKEVNDKYGHEIGDRLLFEIANRIQGCIRKNDFVSRIGGDEFVIFISDINNEFDGEAILKRVKYTMEEPFAFKHIILQNTLSVGYSIFPKDGSSIEVLIQKADNYMYNMKRKNHRENHLNHFMKYSKINNTKKND